MNFLSLRRRCTVAGLALVVASCGAEVDESREIAAAPAMQHAPAPPAASSQAASGQQPTAAAKVAYAGELPPLPVSNYRPARPPDVVNAVYEFAARRPDVLRYVPCFCGCERNGHVHNEHCFVSGREADGKPKWDAHGMTWGICLDVARDAMQMHNAGVDLGTIRQRIEQKYRTDAGRITPTPPVPK